MPKDKLSHEDLRKLAVRWLKTRTVPYQGRGLPRGGRCAIAASELVSSANDTPDAIGWDAFGRSILIECKSSRSDFLADRHKTSRQNGNGMGNQRYFLTPPKLATAEDLPEGWGLLETAGDHIYCTAAAPVRELTDFDQCQEKLILLSMLRRINKREFLIIQSEEMDTLLEVQ